MNSSRRAAIKEMLTEKPFVSLKELEDAFPNVSSMTLRRDIEYFEQHGDAIKVRGGARSMKFITTSMEDSFHQRLGENTTAKERIAGKAISMIEPGHSLFLDSGTTMLRLAEMLPDERNNIITTGPNIALELIKKSQPIVNLVGGMINRDNVSISGNQALAFLDSINIDLAFICPSGFSLKDGFTSGNYPECELKRLVVGKARKVVVLMDRSKLDRTLPYTFCHLDRVQTIITDEPLPDDVAAAADEAGIEVIVTR